MHSTGHEYVCYLKALFHVVWPGSEFLEESWATGAKEPTVICYWFYLHSLYRDPSLFPYPMG